jgi:hypothetical protein
MDWEIIGGWLAAGFTLFIFSFLYKDNPFYRIAEHFYLGVSVGFTIIITLFTYLEADWYKPLFFEGKIWLIFPAILGIFIVARLIPQLAWISRFSFAFLLGYGAGLSLPRALHSYLFMHAEKTVAPVLPTQEEIKAMQIPPGEPGHMSLPQVFWINFSDFLIVIGVLTVLIYFFFSIEHRGVIRIGARIGILFLMVFFGASYGATVMGRLALLQKRLDDLKEFSGPDYGYASLIIAGFLILFLVIFEIIAGLFGRRTRPT